MKPTQVFLFRLIYSVIPGVLWHFAILRIAAHNWSGSLISSCVGVTLVVIVVNVIEGTVRPNSIPKICMMRKSFLIFTEPSYIQRRNKWTKSPENQKQQQHSCTWVVVYEFLCGSAMHLLPHDSYNNLYLCNNYNFKYNAVLFIHIYFHTGLNFYWNSYPILLASNCNWPNFPSGINKVFQFWLVRQTLCTDSQLRLSNELSTGHTL